MNWKALITSVILGALASSAALAWDLSSDLRIKSASKPIEGEPARALSLSQSGKSTIVRIRDYFYHSGEFSQPWMSAAADGPVTLHIGTASSFELFSSKEEFQRVVEVEAASYRLPKDVVLYVYNDDTQEVLGHIAVK